MKIKRKCPNINTTLLVQEEYVKMTARPYEGFILAGEGDIFVIHE